MSQQIPLSPDSRADNPELDETRDDGTHEVAPDVAYKRLAIVNVAFYGLPSTDKTATNFANGEWVLIDAGIMGSTGHILRAAEERFGADVRPKCIVMTHGHFDHVGALKNLAERWNVPIYAHSLEVPYLNGTTAYPPPDPTVGGGLMALLSPLYPRGPFDVSQWLQPLPPDGSLPGMPGWRWIPSPGHSPGHVSLWREEDRLLIVGDAFVTTAQESAYSAATQKPEMHGPPMYYTPDWGEARESVRRLAALQPEIVVTGHGRAMQGPEMRAALDQLARDFDTIAVPEHGRYADTAQR
jgi:glyoxylase-like metal-dependent hydrolase (beta-lactamase superfamily II)